MKNLRNHFLVAAAIVTCFAVASCEPIGSEPPPLSEPAFTQILFLQVDYTTNSFVSGKELNFAQTAESFTIAKEYRSPGDFGNIKLFYSELGELLFDGDIIWMGCGQIHFPTGWKSATMFDRVFTDDNRMPANGFETIYNGEYPDFGFSEEDLNRAWSSIRDLRLVRGYLQENPDEKVKVYFYMPSVGVGNPADWKWLFILRRNVELPQSATCKFENPLTDLQWLAEIYTDLSGRNNRYTSISQVNYSGGVGFFVDYGMAFDACGYLYDCQGNALCHSGCWQPSTCTDLSIDWENRIVLWQGNDFCHVINSQNIMQISVLVNQFFDKQATTLRPANELWTNVQLMEEFVAWLNRFDCIKNAEIVCVSCIETLPEQSEVSISLEENGRTITKIMDISMSVPPRLVGFHDK